MSLILDALNRSRREQDASPVPTVDSVHYEPEAPGVSRAWWLVLALVLALAVTLGLWRWSIAAPTVKPSKAAALPGSAGRIESSVAGQGDGALSQAAIKRSAATQYPSPPTVDVESDGAGRSTPLSSQAAATVKTESGAVVAREEGAANEVAALYAERATPETEREPSSETTETADSGSVDSSAAAASVASAEAELSPAGAEDSDPTRSTSAAQPLARATENTKAGEPGQSGADSETPIDIEAVLRRAQQEMGEPRLEPHPVPLLGGLSQQSKDRIPTLIYSGHRFDAGGDSTVTLNNETLRQGQRVEGFTVKEILPDSVVLSWGGTEFRLRALNSWINL